MKLHVANHALPLTAHTVAYVVAWIELLYSYNLALYLFTQAKHPITGLSHSNEWQTHVCTCPTQVVAFVQCSVHRDSKISLQS